MDTWHWLHWLCKPLATFLIFLLAWRAARPVSMAYRRNVLVGIAFCLLGDVLLLLPQDLFVPGLVSFLLAHGWFIAAFSSDVRFASRWWTWLLCLAVGAGNGRVAVVWHPAGHAVAGADLYRCVGDHGRAGAGPGIVAAGREAMRERFPRAMPASGRCCSWPAIACLPGTAFALRCHGPTLYILATYYAALWLIACSVERGPTALTGEQG